MMTFVAIFAFMLIPVWIPVIAVSLGYVSDLFRGRPRKLRSSPSQHAVVDTAVTE
jgi:hypothetical protein